MRTRTRRVARAILIVALAGLAVQQFWRHSHDYLFAERFAAIEPGRIYRSAWLKPWPLQRVVDRHGIKTIIALAHPPDSPLVASKHAKSRELGFRFVHIPIVDDREQPDGEVLFNSLEAAAAEIADPENQPVLFHCHHGVNRASMAHMAYRMLYCDYTLDEAEEEIAREFGLKKVNKGPDYRHMRAFYENRVLPRRASASASAGDDASRR